MVVHEDIERELEQQAGIYAVAESDGDEITLSGLIQSELERQTAWAIVASMAPGKRIIDNLEIVESPAGFQGKMVPSEVAAGSFL